MNLISSHKIQMAIISEANSSSHWKIKWQRSTKQKNAVNLAFAGPRTKYIEEVQPNPHVNLIRISPRKLDSDNLISAFKSIRDALASLIKPGLAPGRADDDGDITWSYDQKQGSPQGIIIEFYKKGTPWNS